MQRKNDAKGQQEKRKKENPKKNQKLKKKKAFVLYFLKRRVREGSLDHLVVLATYRWGRGQTTETKNPKYFLFSQISNCKIKKKTEK